MASKSVGTRRDNQGLGLKTADQVQCLAAEVSRLLLLDENHQLVRQLVLVEQNHQLALVEKDHQRVLVEKNQQLVQVEENHQLALEKNHPLQSLAGNRRSQQLKAEKLRLLGRSEIRFEDHRVGAGQLIEDHRNPMNLVDHLRKFASRLREHELAGHELAGHKLAGHELAGHVLE